MKQKYRVIDGVLHEPDGTPCNLQDVADTLNSYDPAGRRAFFIGYVRSQAAHGLPWKTIKVHQDRNSNIPVYAIPGLKP